MMYSEKPLYEGQALGLCPRGYTMDFGIAASGAAIWYATEKNSSGMISSQITISFAIETPKQFFDGAFRIHDFYAPHYDLAVAGKYALGIHSDDLRALRADGWTRDQIGDAIRAGRAL